MTFAKECHITPLKRGTLRCGVVVGGRRTRLTRQRERLALIKRADAALVEAGFLDQQIGAV